jgi:hypothetical protein
MLGENKIMKVIYSIMKYTELPTAFFKGRPHPKISEKSPISIFTEEFMGHVGNPFMTLYKLDFIINQYDLK